MQEALQGRLDTKGEHIAAPLGECIVDRAVTGKLTGARAAASTASAASAAARASTTAAAAVAAAAVAAAAVAGAASGPSHHPMKDKA